MLVMLSLQIKVQDLFAQKHVRLLAPPLMAKGRVSPKATTMTRRIARVRVHVERLIKKLKLKLIRGNIPLTMKPYASSIIRVCACLVNLNPTIIDEGDEDDKNYNIDDDDDDGDDYNDSKNMDP